MMYKKIVLFSLSFVSFVHAERELINGIACVIYGPVGEPKIVTLLEEARKTIDGRQVSKEEYLDTLLIYYRALEYYNISIPDSAVDQHLASLKEMHGISEADIKKMFQNAGYTFEEGKKQLYMSYVVQSLLGQIIDSRIIVTESEIKDFYLTHPEMVQASYKIRKGFIVEEMTDATILKGLREGKYKQLVTWGPSYSLNEDEISDERKGILNLEVGQLLLFKEETGYEVLELVSIEPQHLKSLEESYKGIESELRIQKRAELLEKLRKDIESEYTISYLEKMIENAQK